MVSWAQPLVPENTVTKFVLYWLPTTSEISCFIVFLWSHWLASFRFPEHTSLCSRGIFVTPQTIILKKKKKTNYCITPPYNGPTVDVGLTGPSEWLSSHLTARLELHSALPLGLWYHLWSPANTAELHTAPIVGPTSLNVELGISAKWQSIFSAGDGGGGDASVPLFFSPQMFTTVIHKGNVLLKRCSRGCVHTDPVFIVLLVHACREKPPPVKNPSITNCLDISLRWASWHFQGSQLPGGEKPSSSCTSFLLAWGFGCSSRISKAGLVDEALPEGIFLSCNVFVSGLLATLCWPALSRCSLPASCALAHVV